MKIGSYYRPESVEDAYRCLQQDPESCLIAGCTSLKLSKRYISRAIDITALPLEKIAFDGNRLTIGSVASLRDIETNPFCKAMCSGVLGRSVEHIMGPQLRRHITIGGMLGSRPEFSELICVLLALNAQVEYYKNGCRSMEQFLSAPPERDVILAIQIPAAKSRCSLKSIRTSYAALPILCTAVALVEDKLCIAVGARPEGAVLAKKAAKEAEKAGKSVSATEIASMVSEELVMKDDLRSSQAYRKAMCKVLVRSAIEEVTNESESVGE